MQNLDVVVFSEIKVVKLYKLKITFNNQETCIYDFEYLLFETGITLSNFSEYEILGETLKWDIKDYGEVIIDAYNIYIWAYKAGLVKGSINNVKTIEDNLSDEDLAIDCIYLARQTNLIGLKYKYLDQALKLDPTNEEAQIERVALDEL